MKQIKFNYSIGDTVTLIKEPSWKNRSSLNYDRSFSPKDYKIKCIKYVVDEEGEKILYQLDAYIDKYLDCHNWMDESCFKGNGTEHVEDIDFTSVDGKELKLGDFVYDSIYYGSHDDWYISPTFTFTSYGKIIELNSYWEGNFLIDGSIKISQKKNGVAVAEKYWMTYGNYVGQKYSFFAELALKDVDDKFIEDYIKACKTTKFNPFSNSMNSHDKETCEGWLKYMGIYDKVKNKYKKVTVRKRVKIEKDSTVDDIISELTEKQKKEMLKKLTEKLK